MQAVKIIPASNVNAEIIPPGDKSISHRAIMFGAIAEGDTRIKNLLASDDVLSTISVFEKLGVSIKEEAGEFLVKGVGLRGLKPSDDELFSGNSGTTARLVSGILAGQDFESALTGDDSLSQRPMNRVIQPLQYMGAEIKAREDNFLPLKIIGRELKAIEYISPVASAQVKSAILLAGLYARGITSVTEPAQSRDHTEVMLKAFGADIISEGVKVSINPDNSHLVGREILVPADFSSASFFIVAGILLDNSRITIINTGINPTRTGLLDVLKRMDAKVELVDEKESVEPTATIIAKTSPGLKATCIKAKELPRLIDEVPILMVAATQAEGITIIEGAGELRVKETDRIDSMSANLKKMGAKIIVKGDRIEITGKTPLKGAELESLMDHRTAMASAIAALCAKSPSTITDSDCVAISYPGFFDVINSL